MNGLSPEERQRLAECLADAVRASGDAEQASGQAQAQAARQAAEIEALLEGGERLALRGRDLRAGVQELRDTLERGRLSTLNAALEGARLGEVAGKALLAMTEEVRTTLGRSADVLDDHATRVAELERERERLVLALGPLADAARAVASEVTRAAERNRSQRAALSELALELRQRLGVDPELGGLVARAAREASDLLDTLAALEERGARSEALELRRAHFGARQAGRRGRAVSPPSAGGPTDKRERSLDPLLASEVEKRLPALDDARDIMDVRAALHSLKGSLAMAGYPDLALVIGQHSTRIREGDLTALGQARELLSAVLLRLSRGEPAIATRFPEPPEGLAPARIDERYRVEYHGTMRDRLGELDAVLASTGDALGGLNVAKRSVHAMKGAAASVGDDVTAWYCHGLESRLRAVQLDEVSAASAVVELARHRAMLALLLEDCARGIATLRMLSGDAPPPSRAPGSPPSRRGVRAKSGPPSRPPAADTSEEPGQLRIAPVEVDRFFERIEHVSMVGHELFRGADLARQTAGRLRAVQTALHEALRLLEPSRLIGNNALALSRIEAATATLRANATNAERGAAAFRRGSEIVERRSREMRGALLELRRTTVGTLFDRLSRAVTRFADEEGKRVTVELSGGELPIDRRVADRLYDALIQLAKNAVTHGIEAPDRRRRLGKQETGTIWLRATRLGEWLRVVVEDDGHGVDTARLRQLAVERGVMSRQQAERSPEGELLLILFLPGLTTSKRADLLAGRGIGLDLAEDAVRRLGGTIHLRSREQGGLLATLEVPSDQSVVDVLWLRECGDDYALPVDFTGVLALPAGGFRGVRLAACLGRTAREQAPISIELCVEGALPVAVGVEQVVEVESVAIRSVPSLIALSGPFSGAVLRPDGQLKLALDVPLLAARAWALAR